MGAAPIAFEDVLATGASDKRIEVLRSVHQAGSISQAARANGVSYKAAWQAVAPAYAGRPVVLAGRSLGTGLAAHLAADLAVTQPAVQRPAALLLVSPYTSLQALAAQHYPLAPGALLRYPMRTDAALQTLAAAPGPRPALVLLHGGLDAVIPASHSDALAAQWPGARVQHFASAGHNDLQAFDPSLAAVRAAVRAAVAAGAAR
jgi:pimeloyl-ACP methyl ester carboxylesterase